MHINFIFTLLSVAVVSNSICAKTVISSVGDKSKWCDLVHGKCMALCDINSEPSNMCYTTNDNDQNAHYRRYARCTSDSECPESNGINCVGICTQNPTSHKNRRVTPERYGYHIESTTKSDHHGGYGKIVVSNNQGIVYEQTVTPDSNGDIVITGSNFLGK